MLAVRVAICVATSVATLRVKCRNIRDVVGGVGRSGGPLASRTRTIHNDTRGVLNAVAGVLADYVEETSQHLDMYVGDEPTVRTYEIDVRLGIQIIVGMFVIGNFQPMNQAEFFEGINRIVHGGLANHRKDAPHPFVDFGYGGMPAVLDQCLTDCMPLGGRTFAGRFKSLEKILDFLMF